MMKYWNKRLLFPTWLSLVVLLPGTFSFGQDFRTVMEEVRRSYEQSDKMHVIMKIKVYDEGDEANPYYQQTADVKRDGTNYRYRLGPTEMLMNGKYLILVNRDSREIICSLRDLAGEKELAKNPIEITMDSVLSFFHAPILVDTMGSLYHYRVGVKRGNLEEIDLYIDFSRKMLRKIEYRYHEKQLAAITFETFTSTPEFAPGVFDERNYVIISGKEVKPSKSFAHYHILQANDENETPN